MSSEEIEADAWATFSDSYRVMDDLDVHEEYVIVDDDTHKEPLYSAERIQKEVNQRLQAAKDNPMLSEAELKEIQFHLNKLKEVFSNEQ